jgi:2-oxoglutarate ferredoxin oxidoreductase subunit alpha
MSNTIALGAAPALVDYDLEILNTLLIEHFGKGKVADGNIIAATSGSGFCLMVEGLGLAGITETPIVIIDAQRPGPAVGLPTRTEQGNLQFVLYAHHGDFPRVVLAPASVEDAFWVTVKAFNQAEKYQLPVIILTDQHLASSYATVDPFDLSKVTIDRGLLFSEKENESSEYMRHQITKSGISPRAFPGLNKALVVTDCDEHDEEGHLTEDAGERTSQVQKRLRKMFSLRQELGQPHWYGPKKAETGRDVSVRILKFDGRPFTPAYIAEVVRTEGC